MQPLPADRETHRSCCYINPSLGPALPVEERISFVEKVVLLRRALMPILLILLVTTLFITLLWLGPPVPRD